MDSTDEEPEEPNSSSDSESEDSDSEPEEDREWYDPDTVDIDGEQLHDACGQPFNSEWCHEHCLFRCKVYDHNGKNYICECHPMDRIYCECYYNSLYDPDGIEEE